MGSADPRRVVPGAQASRRPRAAPTQAIAQGVPFSLLGRPSGSSVLLLPCSCLSSKPSAEIRPWLPPPRGLSGSALCDGGPQRVASGRGPLEGPRSQAPRLRAWHSWPFPVVRNKDRWKFLHVRTAYCKDLWCNEGGRSPRKNFSFVSNAAKGQLSRHSGPSPLLPFAFCPLWPPQAGPHRVSWAPSAPHDCSQTVPLPF